MKKILMFPFTLLASIFGKINWLAPSWLAYLDNYRRTHPLVFFAMIISIIMVIGSVKYYQSLPKPITVKAEIRPIGYTPNRSNAKPDKLSVRFVYDLSRLNKEQKQPHGYPSVARIDLIGKNIKQGISLSPNKKGHWQWVDDRILEFTPESDWSAGIQYKVNFDANIFVNEAKLSSHDIEFSTPRFATTFSNLEFYQDPINTKIRRVISTIQFSHPVNKESLEKRLSMKMRPSNSNSNLDDLAKPYTFEVSYDKNLREAYIQSHPIELPNQPNYMNISLAVGVKGLLGGKASSNMIDKKILIPDVYSFLKVNQVQTQIVRNEQNQPEQVMMLEFTDEIEKTELSSKLKVYILPKKTERLGKNYWRSPREVTPQVLENRDRLDLKIISNKKSSSKTYSFVIDAPENRYLYIKIDAGLKSVNNFIQASFFDAVTDVPSYPKEVTIAGEGSLLTYSGEHKLSILSRGVPALKYSVGRLLDRQLNHLISQTRGDISSPSFSSWTFQPENIAKFSHKIVDMVNLHPKQSNYSSIDLTEFLSKNKEHLGLFFIKIQAWNKKDNRPIYGVSDERLIMISNLGLVVKNNSDRSHDIFVQSLKSKDPVAGATVELLGKNGISIFSKITSTRGHVKFPSTRDFRDEQQPTVWLVKTKNDISFIPYNRYSRQLNLSKFDIGGVNVSYGKNSLNAYLFSDRGIYRPGEKINIGAIVKNYDFSNIQNIPLELVVRGPRNNEVKIKKLTLSDSGFFDFQYQTKANSNTGNYSVSLHLVGNDQYRRKEIGSTNFKLEEFQPDTMKIKSEFENVNSIGWNDAKSIDVSVSLQNLFGMPAQNRSVTGHVIIKPTKFVFSQYKDYSFSDPYIDETKRTLSLDEMLPKQETDADGLAAFNIDLQQFSQGSYNLHFSVEGFELGGGRSVVANNAILISPLSELVGYKADGRLDYIHVNSQRKINFIAINKTLDLINKSELTFRLLRSKNISTLVKQYNNTYKYQSVKKQSEVSSQQLVIKEKGYDYIIDSSEPGDYVIEIVNAQGLRLSRLEFSIVGEANLAGKLDRNSELQLKLNKSDYLPGELIELSIKAPYAGAGLITIENEKVQHFKWFKSDSESSIQTIRMPKHLEGTAYVNVVLVRDINSKKLFTSPLSYAVKPFSIDKSKRNIKVSLGVKKLVRPGKAMEIEYSASKKSKVIIFAIDEGILQVAKYKKPNPLGHFLKKRALGVETMQILDLILPEFELLKSLSASGGDMGASQLLAKNINPFSRKSDKPAVFWSGILTADEQTKTIKFDVPDTFAGSLRVMAVAVAEDSLGYSQQSTLVRGPFVIAPKVLNQTAPGDEFVVNVGVTNIVKDSGANAEVSIEVTASEHLTLLGKSKAKLIISEGDEGQFSFRIKTNSVIGIAELKFSVNLANESLVRTASLSVRPAMPYRTTFESGFTKNKKLEIELKRKLFPALAEQKLSASASPLVLVDGLTSYLNNYPHGCTEQIVSKVFPLIGLMSHPTYSPHIKNVDRQLSLVIDKLRERQLMSGGFAFWPGQHDTAEFPSVYVMHFLIEAQSLGYSIPPDMLSRGQYYLQDYVAKPSTTLVQARIRANAIYLLSRLGVVTTNYLVDLEEQLNKDAKNNEGFKDWKKDLLAVYMASTYKLLQKDVQADSLVAQFEMGDSLSTHSDRQTADQNNDFYTPLTNDGQYVFLISKHFPLLAKALPAESLFKLTSKIFKGQYNTVSSAYSILALGAYSQLVLTQNVEENISYSSILKTNNEKKLAVERIPFASTHYSIESEKLIVNSDKPLYFLNIQSGFDQKLPMQAVREGIEIQRVFLDANGNEITTFAQGQEIVVRLRVRVLGDEPLSNVAVIDLLPGGFEVIRSAVSRTGYNWKADYVDIREDRVVYYGNFDSNVRELTYKVKLTASGTFIIPPSYVESMYDRSIRGLSKAGRFIVTKQSDAN